MGHGPKKVTHIFGGTDILMTSGERLLIGRPEVFTFDFKEFITRDQPIRTDTVIRQIQTLSLNGYSKLYKLLTEIDCYIPVVAMPEYVLDKVRRYVDDEKLLALVLPPLEAKDTKIDPKKLGDMGPGLRGNEGVNPDIDIKDTKFKDLNDMKAKLVYVIKRSPDFINGAKIIEAFKAALTPFVIISTAVVLAAWAASHFTGVGFAIDAVLLAIGWAMIGWGIFSALKKLLKCLKMIHDAKSIKELDKAAEMLADAIVMLGVDTFIGLLTRGAGKLRMPAGSKKKMAGGASGKKSKADIEADNKAKADAAKTPRIKRSLGTKQDVEDVYSSYPWIDSKDKLQSHMDGTDFSKPIYKTDLPEGTTVIQYVRSDNGRVGTHFAPPGTSMDELGINGDRILKSFTTTKPVQVIETTAAEFPLNIVPDVGGSGGGQQYIFGPDFADFLSGG